MRAPPTSEPRRGTSVLEAEPPGIHSSSIIPRLPLLTDEFFLDYLAYLWACMGNWSPPPCSTASWHWEQRPRFTRERLEFWTVISSTTSGTPYFYSVGNILW
jgi:hypothetical protein